MLLCSTLVALAGCLPQVAGAGPPTYALRRAFPGQAAFDKPLLVAFQAADPDHAYVVEQDGVVLRIPRDPKATTRQRFLDWTGRVSRRHDEEGLLGLAFDPAYHESRQVYLYWSQALPEGRRQSVISRLRARDTEAGSRLDPDSELVVMRVPQPYGNHNGGTLVFGPDGMLYVALGDGGKAGDPHGNGQDLGTLPGSVLRIDVRAAGPDAPYRIPADNPFVGREGACGEIWCYGLRNPWRISFDRETGELWTGDVGQNEWEEVDRLVRGGNYGWSWREGRHPYRGPGGEHHGEPPSDLIEPVVEYPHSRGLSVIGGHVYRGAAMPELRGAYVYADFITCRLWAVREDRDGGEPRVTDLGKAPSLVVSFAEEPNGELVVCCFDGHLYRLGH